MSKKNRNKAVRALNKFDYALISAVVISIISVVVVNFITSYGHIYLEDIRYGGVGIDATLTPVGIDSLLLALSITNVFAAIHDRSHWALRAALIFAVGGTVAANAAYGAGWGLTGGLLATWSPVALLIAVEAGLYVFRIMSDLAPAATVKPKRGRPVGSGGAAARTPRTQRPNPAYQKRGEIAIPQIVGRVEPVNVLDPFEGQTAA